MDGILLMTIIFLIQGLLLTVSADIFVYSNSTRQIIEAQFRDMPSLFGAMIPPDGIDAMVIPAEPEDGCSQIAPPPKDYPNYTLKWAVLIRRYNCTFEKKIRNAQEAKYHIAIVHNVNSNTLEPMSAQNRQGIYIPSVFVSESTGRILKNQYLFSNNFYIIIDDDSPFDLNRHFLLPFAIVVGMCLLIMLGFMVGVIVRYIKDRRRARRHRLPTSSLKKIPIAKFQKGDPYDTCAICIEDYVEGDKLRILPCSHAYHSKCIDPWLTRNRRVCPVCKRKVFAAGEVIPAAASSDSDTDSDFIVDDRTPLMLPSGPNTHGGTFNNMSENPLARPVCGLWQRQSFSSTTSSSQSNTSIPANREPSLTSSNALSDTNTDANVESISSEAQLIFAALLVPPVRSDTHTNVSINDALINEQDTATIPGTSIITGSGSENRQQEGSNVDDNNRSSKWSFWKLFKRNNNNDSNN